MQPAGSLPCSLVPILGQSSPYQHILSKIHFNIIHSTTSWSSQCLLSFWLSHYYPKCIPLLEIRATYPAHLILLNVIILIILSSYEVPHCAVFSNVTPLHLSSVQIFSSALCSQSSSLNVRDQVSHPYRTTGKIVVLHILIFTFLDSRLEDKRFWTEL
jgi:hypothetical protein